MGKRFMAANFEFEAPYNYHPEIGYLHPSRRVRRQLRLIANTIAIGFLSGATAVGALMSWSGGNVAQQELPELQATQHPGEASLTPVEGDGAPHSIPYEQSFSAEAASSRVKDDGPPRAALGITRAPLNKPARRGHLSDRAVYRLREPRSWSEQSYAMPILRQQKLPHAAAASGQRRSYESPRRGWNW